MECSEFDCFSPVEAKLNWTVGLGGTETLSLQALAGLSAWLVPSAGPLEPGGMAEAYCEVGLKILSRISLELHDVCVVCVWYVCVYVCVCACTCVYVCVV